METKPFARRALLLLLASFILPVHGAAASRPGVVDVTHTARGRALIAEQAEGARRGGPAAVPGRIRAWEIGRGDFILAERLPRSFRTSLERDPESGVTTRIVSFDVEGRLRTPQLASAVVAAAGGPWWLWLEQYCFSRWTTRYGWMDSCYKLHGMVNEGDPRDFYSLEQYGSVGATTWPGSGIYSAFVDAVRASDSATMTWIDWSPRSSLSGSCRNVPLTVTAMSVALSASGVMCERWTMAKGSAAGSYRQTWSCGCAAGFGVGHPETRELDYLQVVSVLNGRVPRWTLSQGFHAR